MMFQARFLLVTLALTLLVNASAQEGSGGDLVLTPGFSPDPQTLAYIAGGSLQTSEVYPGDTNAECFGYIAAMPDHVLTLAPGDTGLKKFGYLRMAVESDIETTLVIENLETGEVVDCYSDPLGSAPRIEKGDWLFGSYGVYVGTFEADDKGAYTLSLSEFDEAPLAQATEDAQASDDPALPPGVPGPPVGGSGGDITLAPGFFPDPQTLEYVAGGPRRAVDICAGQLGSEDFPGWIADTPDHILTLEPGDTSLSSFGFLSLSAANETGASVTIVVANVDTGDVTCGYAPLGGPTIIAQDDWPFGRYEIYVGTLSPDTFLSYTLSLTEFR